MSRITLQIDNFQTIKQAKINLEGLVVIGGKNSSGKSSVGKILMALIKTDNKSAKNPKMNPNKIFEDYSIQLFGSYLYENAKISICKDNIPMIEAKLKEGKFDFCSKYIGNNHLKRDFLDCALIQTPFVWDLQDFFFDLIKAQQDRDSYYFEEKISYPYALYDLFLKLTTPRSKPKPSPKILKISEKISKIIGGIFIKSSEGKYSFFKQQKDIPLLSTASGIKAFGIIYNLIKHFHITPYGYFIFDEPENHLHSIWQVKFAQIIVELVKEGVNIMINTHSPYLLESLQKLKEKEKLDKINFYLADEHLISQIDEDNDKTLERIFSMLNKSFEEIDKIDIQRIQSHAERI